MSAINNKDSVDTCTKLGNYSVKVHSKKYSKWYINLENTVSVSWCQSKLNYVMVLVQIYTLLHFEHLILQKTTYIFCFIVLQTLFFVIKSTWLSFRICWRGVTWNVFMDNFDLVLWNKLNYFLSSGPLYTSVC